MRRRTGRQGRGGAGECSVLSLAAWALKVAAIEHSAQEEMGVSGK